MIASGVEQPRPAAFLDRDGTLIVEREFLSDPDGVEPLPGAVEAVRLLNHWGYHVIGVTNQSGVARGFYGTAEVEAVNARTVSVFAGADARIDQIYYCPHYPASSGLPGARDCDCRKPRRGMIDQACRDLAIDLERSFVVGDRAADMGLARTIGVPGCLVLTGYGLRERDTLPADLAPACVADTLLDAIRWWGERAGLFDTPPV
ncbi:MAG TPA: HAD family hydrolase [Acidobacteriota bacterium]|nr:HAD family hydrolase [Acidobacteriota bacterium]